MSTNFESAYHNTQLAHPLLKASGKGNVIFVSSVAGVVAIRSGTPYAASKGAFLLIPFLFCQACITTT